MCTTDESHIIRAFLENWTGKDEEKSDECGDNVEKVVRRNTAFVFVVNYKLKREDIESEVFDWLYCYLEERKCPYALAVTIASSVSKSMAEEYNAQKDSLLNGGTTHDLSGDELYRESINKMNELCDGYKLNVEEAINLSAKHSVKPFLVSVCAIKNGRRKMEDRHVILHDLNSLFGIKSNKQYSYYGVFDGHAGIHAATYTASHLHSNLIKSEAFKDGDVKAAIKQAFSETDLYYLERSAREGIRSGSTAVCCLFEGRNKLYLAWLGDSQAVLVKNGKPYDVMKPHKPERDDERHRIEEMGGMVSCIDTWRVNGTLAVSRAIGDPEHKPYVSSDPDVEEILLDGSEDFIIMACDGLWDQITPEEATTIVYQHLAENCESDLNDVAENISQILTDNAKKEGSTDNITVIVLFLREIQSILSTPFTPPSPKERSLVNNLLDFNENNSVSNPFANGGDINYNSNENEKNLLNNSTNHIEAPTPPVDTVLSQNNLNFNYDPFEYNSQLKEDQKQQVNPFAEWEDTNKTQDSTELQDSNFITSNVTVPSNNQGEATPQWFDQNSNNPFECNLKEIDQAMADVSIGNSQTNTLPSFDENIDISACTENKVLIEDKVYDFNAEKVESIDEHDLCTQNEVEKVCSEILQPLEIENKESNLLNFDSHLVCNTENVLGVSDERLEESIVVKEKAEDVPVALESTKPIISNENSEVFNIESDTQLNNYDEQSKSSENGAELVEESKLDVSKLENTVEDLAEKTLYFSATEVQSEKLPEETSPEKLQTEEISSEAVEAEHFNNNLVISGFEDSLKNDVIVVTEETIESIETTPKVPEVSSDVEAFVEKECEKKETVEDNVCLTVDAIVVPTDDASDADTEKDLEWKFMAVNESSVATTVEPVKVVETKPVSANKAITKTNTRQITAKTKPLSSQVTSTAKSAYTAKTSKQLNKPAATSTINSAATKRPSTATSKTLPTRLAAKPGLTSITSSTTTTTTENIGNKKVLLSKTTTTRTMTKPATNAKPLTKSTTASKTVACKPNGVKAPPPSMLTEKKSSATTKSVPVATKTTSATPTSRALLTTKSSVLKTANPANKQIVESKILKKSPIATATSASISDAKTRLSSLPTKRASSTQLGSTKARTSATLVGTKAADVKTNPVKTSSRISTGKIATKASSSVKTTIKNECKPVPKVEMKSNIEAKKENTECISVIEEKNV